MSICTTQYHYIHYHNQINQIYNKFHSINTHHVAVGAYQNHTKKNSRAYQNHKIAKFINSDSFSIVLVSCT